jgi:3-hydroxyacyl-CoA dehydrogenase/enoyl-CoA hydratase/3-hydroxybutyryl-CoA epimerase
MPAFQTKNLRLEIKGDSAVLVIDVAGRPVNVFSPEVLKDLEAALDHAAGKPSLKLMGIRSGKDSGFMAGADLHEFTTIQTGEQASALSELGQRAFTKLADLPMPTVALIQGPCLGGGLEFALACDYRLVVDHPKTRLELPEIKLGLIPGWGGTQRLPRVVGLESALHMIVAARGLDAKAALHWGIADALANSKESVNAELRRLGERAVREGKRRRTGFPLRTWRQRLLESNPVGRRLILRGFARGMSRRVPDDMPAPAEALAAVRTGVTEGPAAGFACEREAIGRLATTKACRNLVTLFFLNEAARKGDKEDKAATAIRRVGVVGAGTMGAGIAQLAAVKGFTVVVREVNQTALDAGMKKIEGLFQKAAERGLLSPAEAKQKLEAMGRTTGWEGFADVDLVVEAVIEDLELKRKVFAELEQHTRPDTILATNTSSLLVGQLQEGLRHPERVAGLHFFNPVHRMMLIEVVRTPETGPGVAPGLVGWAAVLGKTPVVVKDSPGFIVNRILMPYLNEAGMLVAEGEPVERIDRAMRQFGMLMGPLELLDVVGLDVAAHVARSVAPFFGDRLKPQPALERMVELGWLGQKTGTGFYRYKGQTRQRVNPDLRGKLGGAADAPRVKKSQLPEHVRTLTERMVGVMVNEAAMCFGEGLVERADVIDLAMVLGTGWAPHRGGPLRYADDRGAASVVKGLSFLAQKYGPRFEPCAELRRRAESGEGFYGNLPMP